MQQHIIFDTCDNIVGLRSPRGYIFIVMAPLIFLYYHSQIDSLPFDCPMLMPETTMESQASTKYCPLNQPQQTAIAVSIAAEESFAGGNFLLPHFFLNSEGCKCHKCSHSQVAERRKFGVAPKWPRDGSTLFDMGFLPTEAPRTEIKTWAAKIL